MLLVRGGLSSACHSCSRCKLAHWRGETRRLDIFLSRLIDKQRIQPHIVHERICLADAEAVGFFVVLSWLQQRSSLVCIALTTAVRGGPSANRRFRLTCRGQDVVLDHSPRLQSVKCFAHVTTLSRIVNRQLCRFFAPTKLCRHWFSIEALGQRHILNVYAKVGHLVMALIDCFDFEIDVFNKRIFRLLGGALSV